MRIIVSLLVMMTGLQAWSQEEGLKNPDENAFGKIEGWVSTADQKPAEGVSVWIRGSSRTTQTDVRGYFSFTRVPEGTKTLVFSLVGSKSQEIIAAVVKDQVTQLQLVLSDEAKEMAEVEVMARRNMNQRVTSIGKLPVAQKDLPQAITVIDRSVMDKQQVTTMSDALQMVNGVYIMSTSGGYQEEIAARGYSFGSSNTFRNGARVNNGVKPEFSSVEKMEVIKGGNAILYGNVGAGGILNIVTRKPKFEYGGSVGMKAGSYNFYKPFFDIYGPIAKSKSVAFRLDGTYENAGSYRDQVRSERFYLNPSVLVQAGKKTQVIIEGDALKDERTPDYGTGAINYQIADIPRDRFLNVPWAYNKSTQYTATTTVTHQFNERLGLHATGSYQYFDHDLYSANRPNAAGSAVQADGNWARGLQRSATRENYFFGSVDLHGKLKTGSISHIILFGGDADHYQTVSSTYAAYSNPLIGGKNIYDTINIFDENSFNKRTDIPALEKTRLTTTPISRYGLYLQDLVTLLPGVKMLAGIRYSFLQNKTSRVDSLQQQTTGFVASNSEHAFSPKVGIVYQPVPFLSVFASYTNNFSMNEGLDVNNQALKPSLINQFETGLKSDLFRGRLTANLTAYRIVNSNMAQTAIYLADGITPNNNSSIKELTGETTSKGIEADIASTNINGFSFMAGYSYNDMRYTKVNGNQVNGNKAGERLRYNPAHTANASLFYTFKKSSPLKGLYLGAGAFYVGDRLAGRNPTNNPSNTNKLMPLPDYLTADLHLGYVHKKFTARIKISNLFNQLSYNAHDDNSINPIAPRMIMGTVRYRWR